MQIKKIRTVKEVLHWTRRDIALLLILSTTPTVLYQLAGWKWLALPWLPIALIGTAVSFVVGFKNNASYDRAWEARKIWGSIVNASRNWVSSLLGYIEGVGISDEEKHIIYLRLVNRHIAWMTALRFQLREPRSWESIQTKDNSEIRDRYYSIEEYSGSIAGELQKYLSDEEYSFVMDQTNRAAQVLAFQSIDISRLQAQGLIDRFQQVDLQNVIEELYNNQGGSERIKNYPYPRQYATLNLFYIRIFTFLVPFGMVHEFDKLLGPDFVWLTIPLSTLAGWIFTTMEKVGEVSENPFEGGPNDIPITQISRNIEIDLLEMIREPHELKPKQAEFGVLS